MRGSLRICIVSPDHLLGAFGTSRYGQLPLTISWGGKALSTTKSIVLAPVAVSTSADLYSNQQGLPASADNRNAQNSVGSVPSMLGGEVAQPPSLWVSK
jgi:hypothetical protein